MLFAGGGCEGGSTEVAFPFGGVVGPVPFATQGGGGDVFSVVAFPSADVVDTVPFTGGGGDVAVASVNVPDEVSLYDGTTVLLAVVVVVAAAVVVVVAVV